MKADILGEFSRPNDRRVEERVDIWGETDPLAKVALCTPRFLAPVPCCSVTRERLREGFGTDSAAAMRQHAMLRRLLEDAGVGCHVLPPVPGSPDMCFTRDVGVATPWGLVALKPALTHRIEEVDHFAAWAASCFEASVRRIQTGRIEGGDICIARPGLLIVGISGVRTDDEGAAEFCEPFKAAGWDVLLYRFDEHFLHLDTIFCMLDHNRALACVDVLDDAFLQSIRRRNIELLPVSYKEARRLGCNVLSLDGRTIVSGASTPRVSTMLRRSGFEVLEVDLDELTACGRSSLLDDASGATWCHWYSEASRGRFVGDPIRTVLMMSAARSGVHRWPVIGRLLAERSHAVHALWSPSVETGPIR